MRLLIAIAIVCGSAVVAQADRCRETRSVVTTAEKSFDVGKHLETVGRWVRTTRGQWVFCPGPNCPYGPQPQPQPEFANPPEFELPQEDVEADVDVDVSVGEDTEPADQSVTLLSVLIGVGSVIAGVIGAVSATRTVKQVEQEAAEADADGTDDEVAPPEVTS